ncbi:K01740 O-acetylhomoserine (thiol)-lyase (plasmid) [Sinorhizobium fredii HH103]|uniref:K01740 O-acetylhomoserine (Thiol)-lyase n=1 Tax=Sinorhizobium fredii (strain HH103) TaxID=1117943 RepID=G9ABY3_SINF1|nr:PLP-dependent transferase [Sinorhizobium fredii]CCE98562.1 K01740 O-acetylhomoserine (thiol)-lyase [Sinorhizobium fredii HH103]
MPISRPLREPIVASVAYAFESFDHCVDTYAGRVNSHAYSRISNPTVEGLERRIATMLGGSEAVAFSSGMAALAGLFLMLTAPGTNIVSSPRLYGGTLAFFNWLQGFGVETRFAEFNHIEAVSRLVDQNTIALFSEPIANPSMRTYDFEAVNRLSEELDVLYILDNTNTVGLFNSLRWADVEVVSATKYVGGHGAAVGGLVISKSTSSKLNRCRQFSNPSGDFSGRRPIDIAGSETIPAVLRRSILRNLGGCMSPFNAFLFSLGCDTLALRMRDISVRTEGLARFLHAHPAVDVVLHPSISDQAHLVSRYFPNGSGGLLSFRIKGGEQSVRSFFDNLPSLPVATNIGDSVTIVQHVETTSHSQLAPAALTAAGIVPDLLRVSVGLEPLEQLIDEFTCALKYV